MNAVDAITTTELSKAAALFGTMKQLRIQLKSADEATLDRAFEQHVQSVLEKLDQRLPSLIQQNQEHSLSDSQTRQLLAVEVIMARHGLYDAAFQQVVMLCQTSKQHFILLINLAQGARLMNIFQSCYFFVHQLRQGLVTVCESCAACTRACSPSCSTASARWPTTI